MKKNMVLLLASLLYVNVIALATPEQQQQFKPKEAKLDRNYDGTIDRIEAYDEKGTIKRIETDTNNDGKMDEWVYYEAGAPVRGEKDLNSDGKADTNLIYDAKGTLIKTETDKNNDGKMDEWVLYNNGVPTKAEKDTNGDGKPDTWINY